MHMFPNLRKNFFAKIYPLPDGCVEWRGALNRGGYGVMAVWKIRKGRSLLRQAHHISWYLKYGVWPKRLRHTCDNRKCVRITHLVEGTQAQNMRDKVERHRQVKGMATTFAKLTNDEVREIYDLCANSDLTYAEIALRYHVNLSTIWAVKDGRTWKHLWPGPIEKRTQGDRIRELAAETGLTYETVYSRLQAGKPLVKYSRT